MLAEITQELTVETATVYNDLSDEMQEYETFIVDKLLSSTMGILSSTALMRKTPPIRHGMTERFLFVII